MRFSPFAASMCLPPQAHIFGIAKGVSEMLAAPAHSIAPGAISAKSVCSVNSMCIVGKKSAKILPV